MNRSVATDVYQHQYVNELSEEKYMTLLTKGLELLARNPNTDKLFVNRFYRDDDLKAVNIAMAYNQELMVRLLLE